LGEVYVDVSEVCFDSMARRVFERDEGLAAFEAKLLHIALDRMIAARIAAFADETAIHPQRSIRESLRQETCA
jgi:hypothetical protein